MPDANALLSPIAAIIDRIVPDKAARDAAKLQLLDLQGSPELQQFQAQIMTIVADTARNDDWAGRARPSFLYVMYIIILWSLPMGIISAFNPAAGKAIAQGMTAYLGSLPEPLYALFGTGYLGYTVARQWGKVTGRDR